MSKREAQAAAQRRMRVLMLLGFQGLLTILILAAALLSWNDPRARLLYLSALLVPVGFAAVLLTAWQRGERKRASGTWSLDWEKAEQKRGYTWLGIVFAVFVLAALATVQFT